MVPLSEQNGFIFVKDILGQLFHLEVFHLDILLKEPFLTMVDVLYLVMMIFIFTAD